MNRKCLYILYFLLFCFLCLSTSCSTTKTETQEPEIQIVTIPSHDDTCVPKDTLRATWAQIRSRQPNYQEYITDNFKVAISGILGILEKIANGDYKGIINLLNSDFINDYNTVLSAYVDYTDELENHIDYFNKTINELLIQ